MKRFKVHKVIINPCSADSAEKDTIQVLEDVILGLVRYVEKSIRKNGGWPIERQQ